MKMLVVSINDFVSEKFNIILNWALNNNITNINILSNGFNKDKLLKLKDEVPSTSIDIKLYLDYKDSYKLSENDIKNCLLNRNDLFIERNIINQYEFYNKRINIINNLYNNIDFLSMIEDNNNYNIFIYKDKKYSFDFQLNLSMKSIFIGIPYLNDYDDFIVLDINNNRIDGYHYNIKNDNIYEEVLFKI